MLQNKMNFESHDLTDEKKFFTFYFPISDQGSDIQFSIIRNFAEDLKTETITLAPAPPVLTVSRKSLSKIHYEQYFWVNDKNLVRIGVGQGCF